MKYFSTRNCEKGYSFEYVFMKGLAEDGGLFIPEKIPHVNIEELSKMTFNKLAFTILRCYIDREEIDDNDLEDIIMRSFWNMPIFLQHFKSFSVLELFHGPTFSFKDVALQMVGNLFEYFCLKRNKRVNIVGATSGDTGSAAINGVRGKRNINCFILYPKDRVSDIQRRQMTTVEDQNIYNLEIDGNFDNCQQIVKELFINSEISNLAAVNSINWGRIVAQMIYYFYAYFQLNASGLSFDKTFYASNSFGSARCKSFDKINFVVPTGNFGNILAGFYAKRMGLPINQLLIATNSNDILYRVISTGLYEIDTCKTTLSPAMDITVSSNFERLLWYLIEESEPTFENEMICEKLKEMMDKLKTEGKFQLNERCLEMMKRHFVSEWVSDMETIKTINVVYKELKYIIDPHTAVGVNAFLKSTDLNFNYRTVCIATAHPGKFYKTVQTILGINDWFIPYQLRDVLDREERYTSLTCDVNKIKDFIMKRSK